MDEGISKLPAPILQRILCFLSQDEAVRTCVLSKSWRHLGSTRPKFCLEEENFGEDKEKFNFKNVLEKSLQVYSDQKLCIEEFSVTKVKADPELVSLLNIWIPIVIKDLGAKKFELYFDYIESPCFDLPDVVFESESLRELCLRNCNLSQRINCSINCKHLKRLSLMCVDIEEEAFAKITSSCPSIESVDLIDCMGFTTIKMHNHRNLKSFDFFTWAGSYEIHLPTSSIREISIHGCDNWHRLNNYFPSLTCLWLNSMPLSNEWFDNFSRNFPCLQDLQLLTCTGFDVCRLSSPSIKNLEISTDSKSMIKATIVHAPRIKFFHYDANISQSRYFSFTTTSTGWKSNIVVSLDRDVSQWFPRISKLVEELSQSQISLALWDDCSVNYRHIELLSVFSVFYYVPFYKRLVALECLDLNFRQRLYGSFFSDLVNGLFCIFRPREIRQVWNAREEYQNRNNLQVYAKEKHHAVELMCKILQMGKSNDPEINFWKQDLEGVSLQVKGNEWHPVEGTISWAEYVAALLPLENVAFYQLRFRLKWRE